MAELPRDPKTSESSAPTGLEAALKAQADRLIRQFVEALEENPAPTLAEIEEAALRFRQHLGQAAAELALQHQAEAPTVPGPACPQCGREMHWKDRKGKTLLAQVGELHLERGYYYCSRCRRGLFPPG